MQKLSLVSERPFVTENAEAIDGIFDMLKHDFPETGAVDSLQIDNDRPTPSAMQWMWSYLMGRQHGNMEAGDIKIRLDPQQQTAYAPFINKLHYGRYSFTTPSHPDPTESYTKAMVLGGTPDDIVSRLKAVSGDRDARSRIEDIIVMAGQRTRWDIPAERSTADIYSSIACESGVDIDKLRANSPWLKIEESRKVIDVWQQPFATEYEIGRAAVEAVFFDLIDWNEYPVTLTNANDDTTATYTFQGNTVRVPERNTALASYDLKNGNRVHVLNAKAVNRPLGVPRPNSDSQTREVIDLLSDTSTAENVIVGTGLPHVRAGLDVAIRLADRLGESLANVTIASSQWLGHSNAVTALGEIPATHKADMRLRAVANGQDPDSPELLTI